MSTQHFKEVIDSDIPKEVEDFLNNEQSEINVSDILERLQRVLKEKKDVNILKLIFSRLKSEIKNKAISNNGNSILFLALDAGKDYFDVFKDYKNINWSVLDKNGSSLLHHALSLENISEESLNFLYEKLGGYECLFEINNDSENALHCAANLKNFKWCLEKCTSSNPNKIKSLLHSVNNIGETPVVKLLQKKDLLNNEALFREIINILKDKGYNFLKPDDNEQNAVSLAVQNQYNVLLEPFLSDNSFKEERIGIAFSAIEHGKDDLLESLGIKDKGNFILKNCDKLIEKYPKRLTNFIKHDQGILSDYIKSLSKDLKSDELFNLFSKVMCLAIDYSDDKLADRCFENYRLVKIAKNQLLSDQKIEAKKIPNLLERQNSTGTTSLDYVYRNNPEMFGRLVQRSFKFKSEVSLKSSENQEPNQTNQKEEITPNIKGLFTSENGNGWYDTGGILTSLADLAIEQNDTKIFVQPSVEGQQRALSDELKEVSNCGEDVIYIRRNPTNEKGKSSSHWIVLYFSKSKDDARNLLVIDPYGANEPSEVIKKATEGIVNNIYVSTTKIQHDVKSCGPISSEVARAIYFQKEELQKLLEGNNQKIDIKQILPDGLIRDAKETGRINYGMEFENFNCSKIRNAHVQTAQAIGETILDKIDTIPSQVLISNILTGKENSRAEQTANLGSDSIEQIYDLCQDNDEKRKQVVSILASKDIADETLDQEIASLLSQSEAKVNQQQVTKLEQTLGEENFRSIKERLDAQIQPHESIQLSNEQKEKTGQIRENFKSELTNSQKYKIDNSLLYKFLCSASVDDIKKYFKLNPRKIDESEDFKKAAFAAARDGDLSRLEAFIDYDNDLIYETDVSGKSLLEAAAENFHSEIVQYIICKHNEIYKDQNGKTAGEVPFELLGFVDNIKNRKDPWAKDLARELNRISYKKDFNESDGLRIDGIFSSHIDNKQQGGKNTNVNDYGRLQHYADVLKFNSPKKFKDILEKGLRSNGELLSLLSHNGHNLITLTAALGTLDHWKEIEKAYSKVEKRTAISASLDDMSYIGSSIQAAIIADNLPMYNHFFDSRDGFIVNKQYGKEENNVLHTILQSNKVELLNDIFFKFKDNKDNKKPLVEALQQINKDNKSPLDLALEKCRYGFFEKAIDVIVSYDKEIIKDSLIANDCKLIKSVVSLGNERAVERVLSLQDEYNKNVKDKKDQLNLLNYNNRYDKENKLEKSGLLNFACQHNNVRTASYILKLLKEENKESSKVLMNALTASISKDSNNKEMFDFLFSQDIDFKILSGKFTTPIHKAAECGNTRALQYFINKFPEVLNLQDENGKTPLHLAISNGNRKAVEFLVENGADFDKPYNKDITPFELALGDNRFADICIDLLKHNPKATIPLYRAILSGNNSLIKELIDQNHWVLDQCNPDTLKPNPSGEETALKFALRNGVDKNLTAKIADKSIENFKELNNESQKVLLEQGFLNDIVKSSIYTSHPVGKERAGEVTAFIKSEIEKDNSLLSITSQGTTLLYDVVSSNNEELFRNIENYIKKRDVINEYNAEGYTPFQIRNIENYIKKRDVINEYNAEGYTPFQIRNIENYIKKRDVINEYNAEGYTPFQIAAKLGYKEIYDLLKEKGGDLEFKTKDGNSIAHLLVLSAMKDPTDGSYEYQELLKNYPELTKYVNNEGDDLLAAAVRCTSQDKASEIMTQLLNNEFKYKKDQFTKEDAVRLLSNAISSNNFDVVQKVVFNNMKGTVVNKIASAIAGDDTDKTFKAKVRRTIAHTIAPNSQEYIHNINKTKVLSQSIKESLLSNEKRKQSLLQNALSFLRTKAQKDSSNKVKINELFNFLVEDQNSHANSKGDLFLVEEEVKVSSIRKNIFENQRKLNEEIDDYKSNRGLPKIKVSQDVLYCRNLEGKSIADRVFTSDKSSLIKGVILENEDLWDPRFVDSKGNTLLHKLAGMVEEDDRLIDYIQPLIDQGFSLTRKNSEGKSAQDIFKDINIDFIKQAEDEEKVHELFEKKLNSLLERESADDLAKAIHNDEQGCKKYYGTIFNPFHSVVSSCFNGDLSNDYLFNKKLNCFKQLLESNDLRSALDKTDERRCNFLHRAIEEAAANYSGSDTNKMLNSILLNKDFKLRHELFFKQRNSNGDNVIEALSKVPGSLNIFEGLEEQFSKSKNAFVDECDFNLILVNAAGSKNGDLFKHVIEKYALNRFRTPSEDGQSPLHAAVMSGDQKTVLAVLESGANINQINSSGRTALHELLIFLRDNPNSQEHMDLVNYLVSRGAFFGPYQKEERNKERGEISEVIESMDEDIKEKILFSIARGRSGLYDLKHSLLSEAENFIKLKNKPLELDLDVAGSVVFIKIGKGTFKGSQFLNSDTCKLNHLTASYFDIDGCKGYIQKSVSGKRNYVIFEDSISKKNDEEIRHSTEIKVWLSEEWSITVLVSADGTIEPSETSHIVMGVEVKDSLLKYKNRKEEFKRDHSKYESYIEELWKEVDSENKYKNEVYIGGIPFKKALTKGHWRGRSVQNERQIQSEERDSPEHNIPNHSRRNSGGDEMGETLEDAQIGQSDVGQAADQLQPESNNIIAADAKSYENPATEAVDNKQEGITRLGAKNQKNNQMSELEQRLAQPNKGLKSVTRKESNSDSDKLMSELEQRLAQPNKGLKSVTRKESNSDSDKLMSELEQRLAQPNKELKKLNPREYYISPETKERLGDLLGSKVDGKYLKSKKNNKISVQISNSEEINKAHPQQVEILNDEKKKNLYENINQAVKGIEKGLEDIVKESIQALISSDQEVKNTQLQQVEKLDDERKKNFYKAAKGVAETLKDIMGIVEESQISNSKEQKSEKELKNAAEKMELNLNPINHNGNVSPNTPDSGYVSTASSPSQEEKGAWDSYEMEDNGIELDGIEFEMDEQKNIPPMRKIFDQEKGIKDSYKSEKQKDNSLLGTSEVYNKAKLIMVEEYKPKLNEVQMVIKNLVPTQNTKNHMGPKAKEKFSKLDTNYKNGQNLRTGNKLPLPPIPNNKSGRCR